MKKLPIGISEFSEMIKGNYYYVDKTLLIKDIIDLPGKVKLITRPRRFGKTLNMKMLQEFFSLNKKEELFNGFKIWEETGIVKDYYHKYPIVFITFKEIKDMTWESAKAHMMALFSENAKEHLQNKLIKKEDRKYLEGIAYRKLNIEEYFLYLKALTRMYYDAYGRRTILLIDEYDVPIEAAYTYEKKDKDYYDNMVAFMRNLLTAALKDNEYLEFGVLTGVYRIAKESIFSGLNNLAVYTVFNEGMDDKFGFTEDEVNEMIFYYNLTKEDKEIIDKWYSGYIVGEAHNLYNPWSVVNYVSERINSKRPPIAHAKKYWIFTSENQIIKDQVINNKEVHNELLELIKGEEINKTLDTSISLIELEKNESGVWVLFASSGYLSPRYNYDSGEAENFYLRIPNEEVMRFFKGTVIEWIKEKTGIDGSSVADKISSMLKRGEYKEFAGWLTEFLIDGLSYYDVAKDESERFYKGFLLGMLAITVNGYVVGSERESGYGRLDVVVYPKDKNYGQYAAIFEVKKSDDEKELEEKAKEALKQIKERKYYAKMQRLGYKVIGFGIAFCGKNVKIQVDTL